MARPRRILNDAPGAVIEKEILKQDPEGLEKALEAPVKVATEVPKMEEIVFRNERDPGYMLEFHYSSATHPLHQYKLMHGQKYTLPVEVIEWLESRQIPLQAYRRDAEGLPKLTTIGSRYMFVCKPVRDPRKSM